MTNQIIVDSCYNKVAMGLDRNGVIKEQQNKETQSRNLNSGLENVLFISRTS